MQTRDILPWWHHTDRRRPERPAKALSRDPLGTCLFCGGRPEDQCLCDLALAAYDLRVAPAARNSERSSRRGRLWRRLLHWVRQR